ncbi:unnamed protein product [Larinioides sclopetarius]|uniref:Uncharacterized protein n=1 Tax=Larinioides sclopetarius TaxID=280406 RepID=A0AAV2A9B6_9ARAC
MAKQLRCVQLLSLKQMTLRKVAVILWSDPDTLAAISKFQLLGLSSNTEKEWRETIESKIKDKMSKFELPESLKEQMIDIVEPMGIEIRKWKARHQEYFDELYEENHLPDSAKLCFTTAGMIDYVTTAKELLSCDALLLVQRYRIACLYCLEDYIPLLWKNLVGYWKEDFSNDKGLSPSLPSCWSYLLKGELYKLEYLLRQPGRNLTTFNQYAFEHSVETGNKAAAEYFFPKLTHEEKEASLMKSTHALLEDPYEDNFLTKRLPDLLCYLLSVMTPEQQMEITEAHPADVLLCFLDFPLQDLFSENASLIWTFLPPSSYFYLLQKMVIRFSYPGHYVPRLFQEFFIQSPPDLKKCFVCQDFEIAFSSRFLAILVDSEDSESIKVMFRNLETADRVKLVFERHALDILSDLILKDRWDRVEVCLREAALSKEDSERFKKAIIGVVRNRNTKEVEWKIPSWKKFLKFFKES